MDNSNSNYKNILVELESFKSKECIFKMKENNFIKDKEILEDTIKKFQTELQEKSEVIRSLRRDLNTQSSSLVKDVQIKNNELEKVILENDDLRKQNIIFQETIDHHVQRIETLKLDMDKQQKFFEREIECKTRLAGFYESSSHQKENKILQLTEENEKNLNQISDLKLKLNNLNTSNQELAKCHEESLKSWEADKLEKDQEISRIKIEIIQLQQNGMSELNLEKMNPIAAATLKVLKSSKGLMEIYSELHSKIAEVDQLQMEKDRLIRNNDFLECELLETRKVVDQFSIESNDLKNTSECLKSRLLSLVGDLRTAESKRNDAERQLVITRNTLAGSNKEIQRLNEQVRLFIVVAENGSQIKQEAVDADSGLYVSVQELQDANLSLRINNEQLTSQLALSDTEQYKQRCDELHAYSDKLNEEIIQLRQENSASKSQLLLHEKQVKLLRYLIDLKSPGSSLAIENGLKQLEHSDNVVSVDCENDYEPEMESTNVSMDNLAKEETSDKSCCIPMDLDSAMVELLDNKRASDEVYVSSIEQMREQLVDQYKRCNELQDKWLNCNEQMKEEKEMNDKYKQECSLLRSLNKNLSTNTATLESHIEDLKLKLESKITLLAERKAELDSCKNFLDISKSEQLKLRIERDELLKTVNVQEQIMTNITSLQSGVNLADHFYRTQNENKISNLENLVQQHLEEIVEKENTIATLNKELEESKALEAVLNEVIKCDIGCQTIVPINEPVPELPDNTADIIIDNTALLESMNQIQDLQQLLETTKCLTDQQIAQLSFNIEKYEIENKDLIQKCEFFETQIGLQEKARQEILSENIKLTEEAHDMNASLKTNLFNCQEELSVLKIRLEEAENVERTVQIVIDKYIKEASEAKAKYKRELTLHAADSKLLEAAHKEIESLRLNDRCFDDECERLKLQLVTDEQTWRHGMEELQCRYDDLQSKMHECENRNERLYEQLRTVNGEDNSSKYQEIIEDLRNQINIDKMSSSLSCVQIERYKNEIARLREELNDLKEQSSIAIDRLNKSQSEEIVSVSLDVDVIRESNYVLRKQKEKLERTLNDRSNDLETAVEQLDRLRANVLELTDDKQCLTNQKNDLEEEKNRWKDRCTKLVERAEQMDPEQYKNACNDRDKLRKQVSQLETNCQEIQTKLDISSTQQDLATRRLTDQEQMVTDLQLLLQDVRRELQVVNNDLHNTRTRLKDETDKLHREEGIVAQLREIGRKYKNESAKKRLMIVELEKQVQCVNDKIGSIIADKDQSISQLQHSQSELTDNLYELRTRCDCLERINKDNANKLQLREDMIEQLNNTINNTNNNNIITNTSNNNNIITNTSNNNNIITNTSNNNNIITNTSNNSLKRNFDSTENTANNDDGGCKRSRLINPITVDNGSLPSDQIVAIGDGSSSCDGDADDDEEGTASVINDIAMTCDEDISMHNNYDDDDDDDRNDEADNDGDEDEADNDGDDDDSNSDKANNEYYDMDNSDDVAVNNDDNDDDNDNNQYNDIVTDVNKLSNNDDDNLITTTNYLPITDLITNEDFTIDAPVTDNNDYYATITTNDIEEGELNEDDDDSDDEDNNDDDCDDEESYHSGSHIAANEIGEPSNVDEPITDSTSNKQDQQEDQTIRLIDNNIINWERIEDCEDKDDVMDDEDSVVVIEDESEIEDKEEDYEVFLSNIESSIGNVLDELEVDNSSNQLADVNSSSDVFIVNEDQTWNNKLIEMVSSSMLPTETSTTDNSETGLQLATRGRLRRPLRRPNPTD